MIKPHKVEFRKSKPKKISIYLSYAFLKSTLNNDKPFFLPFFLYTCDVQLLSNNDIINNTSSRDKGALERANEIIQEGFHCSNLLPLYTCLVH